MNPIFSQHLLQSGATLACFITVIHSNAFMGGKKTLEDTAILNVTHCR